MVASEKRGQGGSVVNCPPTSTVYVGGKDRGVGGV